MSLPNTVTNLISASAARWPLVYASSTCANITEALEKDYSAVPDPIALYHAKRLLLSAARNECSSCKACPLHVNRYQSSVFGDGNPSAKVLVIGEGPGQFEQRTTIPFTAHKEYMSSRCWLACANHDKCFPPGLVEAKRHLPDTGCSFVPISTEAMKERALLPPPVPNTAAVYMNKAFSGLFTRQCWNRVRELRELTPKPSDLYICNVVKCRSLGPDKQDSPPTKECKEACYPWLDIQLTLVQPQVIVLMGCYAAAPLLGVEPGAVGIVKMHGQIIPADAGKMPKLPSRTRYVAFSVHPSYIIRAHALGHMEAAELELTMRKMWEEVLELCK